MSPALRTISVCSVLLLTATAATAADPCDAAAAHPSDPDRVGAGVATNEVVTHVAIPACRAAVQREPGNARFHYQLGRVLFYWAGANDADAAEAVSHVQKAADLGYRQAEFVRGLLHKRAGDNCAAEPLYRSAAGKGLKSARLSYVHAFVAGEFAACETRASKANMSEYLDGAAEQVSGYYEGLLLADLKRQLEAGR